VACRCWIADILEAAKDVADGVLDAAEGTVQQVERDGNAALNAAKATLSAAQVGAEFVEGQSQGFPSSCMASWQLKSTKVHQDEVRMLPVAGSIG